jgi:hypothetical protein
VGVGAIVVQRNVSVVIGGRRLGSHAAVCLSQISCGAHRLAQGD